MKLAGYLSENGMTETAFAQAIGVSQVTINRYVQGKRFPDRDMIRTIEAATGGKVQPADWYSEEPATPEDSTPPSPLEARVA